MTTRTVEVVLERTITQRAKVAWDIDVPDFEEWYGQSIEKATPDVIQSYIESSRYHEDSLRDHTDDVTSWRETEREVTIHKVTRP